MTLITTQHALDQFCQQLQKESVIAVDTEFLREKTYYPKLCLVQIAGKALSAAIDVLVPELNLKPMFALLYNPSILKVFHAARQDIEIFVHLKGAVPMPLFDTQLAAQVCGLGDSVSYEGLVRHFMDKTLDKTMRFTDWSIRPLSKRHVEYALSDVVHLRQIYDALLQELEETGRMAWVKEEMEALHDIELYRIHPEDAWKKLRLRSKDARFVTMVKALAQWRESEAQAVDIPKTYLCKDPALLEIAAIMPTTLKQLSQIRMFPHRFLGTPTKEALLQVVKEAKDAPLAACPPAKEKLDTMGYEGLVDLLKVLLKAQSITHKVAERLVATVEDLKRIAIEENPDVVAMQGWRYEIFGQYAEQLKAGDIALSAQGCQVHIIPLHKE